MTTGLITPDYIFESSWEVCNKVGGIYTVLSTRANTLQSVHKDKVFFIGPDLGNSYNNPLFSESKELFQEWREYAAESENLHVRVGRWNVPGTPIVFLVDFKPFFSQRDSIYTQMWMDFSVDSLHGYGDYDESCMFAIATAQVVESFYKFYLSTTDKVVFQANEWMLGMSVLYLKKRVPEIATIFTTHATSIGRSIAGNNKPLYDYLSAYNGDQMASELNMQSKHSIEKQAAHNADCFTTVSEITGTECDELLDKPVDYVLMNGFEDGFVPKGTLFDKKRKTAREKLLHVANCLTGSDFGSDTLIVTTSGRYEFKNKGIDVFIEAMHRLCNSVILKKTVLAFVFVPGWTGGPRPDLADRVNSKDKYSTPLDNPVVTHWLRNQNEDRVLGMMRYLGMDNSCGNVKVIFVPCYLDGSDGIVNLSYYDTIIGSDLSVYPSYYEPWGYTPLESIAFHVPTLTTDLAGFGIWAQGEDKSKDLLRDSGVRILHRSDYNYSEIADGIRDAVAEFALKTPKEISKIRKNASTLAEKALWKHFIRYYYKAYDFALRKAESRKSNK